MKVTYGEDARILTHRAVRLGGFLGLFSSEGVEVTGYLSEDGSRKRKAEVEEQKRAILDGVKKEQTLSVLLQEIQGLRESLESRPMAAAPAHAPELHPSLRQLEELLTANEFAPDYIAGPPRAGAAGVLPGGTGELPAAPERRGGMDRRADRH